MKIILSYYIKLVFIYVLFISELGLNIFKAKFIYDSIIFNINFIYYLFQKY